MSKMTVSPEVRARIRQWREIQPQFQSIKPLLSDARRMEEQERKLRAEIGEALVSDTVFVVDGKTGIYKRTNKNNGLNYEQAWIEAMKILSASDREKCVKLLEHKTVILHQITSE